MRKTNMCLMILGLCCVWFSVCHSTVGHSYYAQLVVMAPAHWCTPHSKQWQWSNRDICITGTESRPRRFHTRLVQKEKGIALGQGWHTQNDRLFTGAGVYRRELKLCHDVHGQRDGLLQIDSRSGSTALPCWIGGASLEDKAGISSQAIRLTS